MSYNMIIGLSLATGSIATGSTSEIIADTKNDTYDRPLGQRPYEDKPPTINFNNLSKFTIDGISYR